MKKALLPLLAAMLLPLSAGAAGDVAKQAVLENYAAIARAAYEDSTILARRLQQHIQAFLEAPSATGLAEARKAWRAARVPYMQTEAFRFGNPVVDAWEGKVNAWPLDEGLIDYVSPAYQRKAASNPGYAANVIAREELVLGGETLDLRRITPRLLAEELQELGGVEANVATGYHAVEFLLWGQDLHGSGPGAGERPWTDYARGEQCSNGHCARRAEYLRAVTELLVDDLAWMAAQWRPGGEAYEEVMAGDADRGLGVILTGLGSLSYGELAGERIKLGLMLHDPEEEQDCFADDTHNSHYYDVAGIINVYTGNYTRIDGTRVLGPAMAHLVAQSNPALNLRMLRALAETEQAMAVLKRRAETVEAYDQMIGAGNAEGNAVVQATVDALSRQTRVLGELATSLGLQPIAFEGSDSLEDPQAVFQ
ncbi:imelysin family protein [Alkalilimnicola sp. S0819]|uniref:imelysin family protein n=1 Tax=Alkalilimnicola sp. S0819 TaxID=2613922 RepID=UPI00126290A5|nr:imelysin family protein [Alkalilimnicola sp. S0819]KAB7627296.1 peptidase [Alkalilimnicola sp. S0819]MPQ16010.1 peptidase [Alkalilimnicola sp. S0819]